MQKVVLFLILGIFSLGCDKGINVIPLDDTNDVALKATGRFALSSLQYKTFIYKFPDPLYNARLSVVRIKQDEINLFMSFYEGVVRTQYVSMIAIRVDENKDGTIILTQGNEGVGIIQNGGISITKIADTDKVRYWMEGKK